MSNLKNQMKSTGDTHLAEVESDQPVEGGSPIGAGTRGMQTSRVGNSVKKAGVITDGVEGTESGGKDDAARKTGE